MMTISERAQQLLAARTPFVHATVVRAQQPTSAAAGDEAILLADGTIEGFVGGQCAQNSVRRAAMGVLQAGESVLLRVLPDGDVHFPEAPGACVVVNPCLAGGSLEIFLTPQLPAPLIRVYGATPIADALLQLCAVLGYDGQGDGEGDARGETDLSETDAVVIASHGGPEAEIIRAALDNGVGYIGLVASKVRGASILTELELSDAERARVHTPVGLRIGAKTPAEIAVAIAAELIAAVRSGGLGGMPRPTASVASVGCGPAEAVDPVCGMTVSVGPTTEHLQLAGADYWFCCPGCRTAFAAGKAGA
jgi:xanthine dehydrogenase accessory factor